ncbi:mannose-1-phosphate guanylyltransferase/mannose-6-phosphate isomerase [Hoeflea prorocentri]|uniref:mannose-1-phosphate guanylyltransferase n=1 Tax=Hoeflea prorocentri TaxID=1922333 RepID=A0A9X3ZG76_9HYPH|nr:mannose-1-phosphate guanylyltransferase/mannose-6-phosphate isomerase [Hoeflea prorocentri]MCY6379633.1 mannose-1-phosphate guanylyltransferase/mannose-6-phosphate isomerase [Hoeflea prorocentri]MDA5397433.1 mannose-1-phosphate guanylyltransferase/mannose-6-phosphate isomerase [Hoeflea prorocentri]
MIVPVILAGGSGTRLWPASRKSYPKQFTNLVGDHSLFQESVVRLSGERFAPPMVVTGTDFRFIVADQLDQIGIDGADILLEPDARNTAPAILAAALCHEDTPDTILLVAPSDHQVLDGAAFAEAVDAGVRAAENGEIVTFGITPSSPETGYGYLELSKPPRAGKSQPLKSFVEKPGRGVAVELVEGGRHLWNAGIFMFRVDTIIRAFDTLAPQLVIPCRAALATGAKDLCFFRLGAEAYSRCESISVDYAVMEAADSLHVVPVDCGWSDLGSWRAVHGTSDQDSDGNALSGSATQIGCSNSMLRSDRADTRIVGLGLENIAAIATDDAILVANMNDSEQVKDVVAELKLIEAPQADEFRRCERPWGHYETLSLGARFQVKRIVVKPGGRLSLQSHQHRAEHWVVVEGTATVVVGETVSMLSENESTYIPLGAVHRLENQGKVPLTLIEVQSGAYLGEDDITRYEDIYARVEEATA